MGLPNLGLRLPKVVRKKLIEIKKFFFKGPFDKLKKPIVSCMNQSSWCWPSRPWGPVGSRFP